MTEHDLLQNNEIDNDKSDQFIEKQITKKKKNVWLIIITIILFLVLLISSGQFFITYRQNQIYSERAKNYQTRVQEAEDLLKMQQDLIFDLMDDYKTDVYDNPNVDNIYHQQLVAAEYSVVGLQIIAIQNTQIIELLAAMP